MKFWGTLLTDSSSPLARAGPWKKRFHRTLFGRWHSLSSPATRGEILIKVFHADINSCWPWPLCGSVYVYVCVYCVAMSSKLVHREMSVTCLSLSCKNAAVHWHDSFSIREAITGCRTFPGKWLEKWQCSLCNINCYTVPINKSTCLKRGTK